MAFRMSSYFGLFSIGASAPALLDAKIQMALGSSMLLVDVTTGEMFYLLPKDFLNGSLGSTPLEICKVVISISNHNIISDIYWMIDNLPQLDCHRELDFHEVCRQSFL